MKMTMVAFPGLSENDLLQEETEQDFILQWTTQHLWVTFWNVNNDMVHTHDHRGELLPGKYIQMPTENFNYGITL